MDRYEDYVNYKIKYFKLKNNIDITSNNFIYDTNTDYNLKYNKYKEKYGGAVFVVGGYLCTCRSG